MVGELKIAFLDKNPKERRQNVFNYREPHASCRWISLAGFPPPHPSSATMAGSEN